MSDTPRTQAVFDTVEYSTDADMARGYFELARQLELELNTANQRIRELTEQHTMELAAISTATVQNTPSSIVDRIGRDNPYWTVAYMDVCRAIDREMVLIAKVRELTEWRPMETAPRDGAGILLLSNTGAINVWWWFQNTWQTSIYKLVAHNNDFKGWLPLPKGDA